MYTRIINNIPVWPYALHMLSIDEPGTSFPAILSDQLLTEFQIFPVEIDSRPDTTYMQDTFRQDPIFEDGKWVQHWEVIEVTSDVIQTRIEERSINVRNTRNKLLQTCDWTQSRDIPDNIATLWQPYRQQLRDITTQSGYPFDIVWPMEPV